MKKNLKNLGNIDKAMNGASMKTTANIEQKSVEKSPKDKMKKIIDIPVEWNEILKSQYHNSVSKYILDAIHDKMKSDGFLK